MIDIMKKLSSIKVIPLKGTFCLSGEKELNNILTTIDDIVDIRIEQIGANWYYLIYCSSTSSQKNVTEFKSIDNFYFNTYTPNEFAERMKTLNKTAKTSDKDIAIKQAEELVCRILNVLGYAEGIQLYKDMKNN